jgi:penicillin V acylase-like amidase (Ntn superfamily)
MKKLYLTILGLAALFNLPQAEACTRVVYTGTNGTVITGRTMDWKEEMHSNIWIFPRGIERNGEVGKNSLKWTSKYGSVVTSAYEIASTDGMNEKGLVANLLWLPESEYPTRDQNKPGLTISAWVQYLLDNFSTVSEAVAEIEKEKFQVITDKMPDGSRVATLHLSISDASGDNAIFEYVKGKLMIHHSKDYQVMTNSPIFEEQLALNEYWKSIGGLTFLPGTNRASDRFARASFYINAIPKTDNQQLAVASVFSVIRNVSVPYGISTPDRPEISSTRWRTVSDSKNLTYFFESSTTPNTFWLNLKDANLEKGAPILKLTIANGETYNGNTIKDFKPSKPFTFLGIPDAD